MIDVTLREMFVYPKNETIREAYVALLGMMKLQKRVRFFVHECVSAIIERNGWVSMYNPGDLDNKPDRAWKKATQYLRTLEEPFFHFVGPGMIELHVFEIETKQRVDNFETYMYFCDHDKYMSEYSSCAETVFFRAWNDVLVCAPSSDGVVVDHDCNVDIARMYDAVPITRDTMKSNFYNSKIDYNSYMDDCVSQDDIEG